MAPVTERMIRNSVLEEAATICQEEAERLARARESVSSERVRREVLAQEATAALLAKRLRDLKVR